MQGTYSVMGKQKNDLLRKIIINPLLMKKYEKTRELIEKIYETLDQIENVRNFEELLLLLNKVRIPKNNKNDYKAKEIITLIEKVIKGEREIGEIPFVYGLREKVIELGNLTYNGVPNYLFKEGKFRKNGLEFLVELNNGYKLVEPLNSRSNLKAGLKFRITADLENCYEVLRIVDKYLTSKFAYKFPANKYEYSLLNSTHQKGKFITVYLDKGDKEELKKLASLFKKIDEEIIKEKIKIKIKPISDIPFGKSKALYFKYGEYKREYFYINNEIKTLAFSVKINGRTYYFNAKAETILRKENPLEWRKKLKEVEEDEKAVNTFIEKIKKEMFNFLETCENYNINVEKAKKIVKKI